MGDNAVDIDQEGIDQEDIVQEEIVQEDSVQVDSVLVGNVLEETHPETANSHWENESLEAHDGGPEGNEPVDVGNYNPDVDSSGHADNDGHK